LTNRNHAATTGNAGSECVPSTGCVRCSPLRGASTSKPRVVPSPICTINGVDRHPSLRSKTSSRSEAAASRRPGRPGLTLVGRSSGAVPLHPHRSLSPLSALLLSERYVSHPRHGEASGLAHLGAIVLARDRAVGDYPDTKGGAVFLSECRASAPASPARRARPATRPHIDRSTAPDESRPCERRCLATPRSPCWSRRWQWRQ
jgi:hypothetical protein